MGRMAEMWDELQYEPDQECCYCDDCREEDRMAYDDMIFDSKVALGYMTII